MELPRILDGLNCEAGELLADCLLSYITLSEIDFAVE